LKRYGPGAEASTLAFNTLTLNELAHAYSSRSEHRHVFNGSKGLPPNPHLNKAILGMAGLQAVVSIMPGFRRLLGTAPMGVMDLFVILGGVLLPLAVNEASKSAMPEMTGPGEDGNEKTEAVEEQFHEETTT
jgi:Ca2+-transporting ATPase